MYRLVSEKSNNMQTEFLYRFVILALLINLTLKKSLLFSFLFFEFFKSIIGKIVLQNVVQAPMQLNLVKQCGSYSESCSLSNRKLGPINSGRLEEVLRKLTALCSAFAAHTNLNLLLAICK